MNKFRYFILFIAFILTSCVGDNNNQDQSLPTSEPEINLSQVAPFVISDNKVHTLMLQLTNNSSNELSGFHSTITYYSGAPIKVNVKLMNCANIPAQKNCLIAVSLPPITSSGSFAVTIVDNKNQAATTFINYTKLNTQLRELNLAELTNPVSVQKDMQTSVVLPIFIAHNTAIATQVSVPKQLSSQLFCEGRKVTNLLPNQLCSVLVTNNANTGSFRIALKNATQETSSLLQINNNVVPNLLIGGNNVVINPADGNSGTANITLLNTGLAVANDLIINANSPLSISNNSCDSSLAVGVSCSFELHATSQLNGQSSVSISYQNPDGTTQTQNLNAIYVASNSSVGAQITTSGSFNSTILNTPAVMTLNITNNGNRTLSRFNFSQLNKLNPYLTYTTAGIASPVCKTDGTQNLPSGSSCNLGITYNPKVAQNGTFNWTISAEYTDANNQSQSYTSSINAVPYSTVDTLNVGYSRDFVTLTQGESAVITVTESSPLSTYPVVVNFTSPDPTNITITPPTCTLTNIRPSCDLKITTTYNSNPDSYIISATTGSKSLNNLYVNLNKRNTYAYLTNGTAKTVTKCIYFESAPFLRDCTNVSTDQGMTLTNPIGLAIYESYLYIGNPSGGNSYRCVISDNTGSLSSCSLVLPSGTDVYGLIVVNNFLFYTPADSTNANVYRCSLNPFTGLIINNSCQIESAATAISSGKTMSRLYSANSRLYAASEAPNSIFSCALDLDYKLSTCVLSGSSGVDKPKGITSYNQYFYFTNSANSANYLKKCSFSNNLASKLNNCGNAVTAPLSETSGLMTGLAYANNYLWVNYSAAANVFRCSIRESDGFLTCANSGATGFSGSNNILFW